MLLVWICAHVISGGWRLDLSIGVFDVVLRSGRDVRVTPFSRLPECCLVGWRAVER
jgi:hypothetical protein